jgi:Tol biopolymer transport system component
VINRLLEKDPDLRYQSAADLRSELKRLKRDSESGRSSTYEVAQSSASGPTVTPAPERPGGRRWPLLLGAAGLLVGGGALVAWLLSARAPDAPAEPIKITHFTTDGGAKALPRLSPDGEKVAYMWTGPDNDNVDIYVKALGAGSEPLRLTRHTRPDVAPDWSPDERQIVFARVLEDGAALYTVPSLGGQEQKVIDVTGPFYVLDYPLAIPSWSPDGEALIFSEKAHEDGPARVIRLSLATLEKEALTFPPESSLGDLWPRLSPDGRHLAFVRAATTGWGDLDLWVQPLPEGQARKLTSGRYEDCGHLAWTPDGREVLFSALPANQAFRVSLDGGAPRPIMGLGQNAYTTTVRGHRLVHAQGQSSQDDIWRVPGRRAKPSERVPEKLIASSAADANPAYSPDGGRIAFSSHRSGASNIWVADSDGSHPVQLTDFDVHTGTPRWSPDGRTIVFDSLASGSWDLYLVDAEGGRPRPLTQEPSNENRGTFSRDGRSVYFDSDREDGRQIWRVPVEGGPAVRVTRGGGVYALEAADGRHLYYSKGVAQDAAGIWRVPVSGGEETEVVREPVYWSDWDLGESGIYFATLGEEAEAGQDYSIQFLDFDSGQVTEVFRKKGEFGHAWLAVSPDEEWILFSEGPFGSSELILVENFR